MLKLVGLDLSLTGTGVAWSGDRHGRPTLGMRTVRSGRDGHERLRDICVEVAAICRYNPHLVVIEGLFVAHNNNTLQLAELHGLIKQQLWANGVPYVLVAPQTRAVYATGNGRADKAAVKAAVEQRYGRLCATTDEADALVLLCMAADRYGQPIGTPLGEPAPVPQRCRRALSAVRWPALDLPDPASGGAALGTPPPAAAGSTVPIGVTW